MVIYQDEAKRLSAQPRFSSSRSATSNSENVGRRPQRGHQQGYFRPDIDVDLVYRFIRDTTWVSVRWYQPGGPLTAERVGRQYLSIVLGGISARTEKETETWPPLKSGPHKSGIRHRRRAHTRGQSATDLWPLASHRSWCRGVSWSVRPQRRRPAAVDDVIVGCLDTIGPQAGNIGRNTWLAAGYPEEVPGVTVDRQCVRASRRSPSAHRPSWPGRPN